MSNTSILVSLKQDVGSLAEALAIFKKHNVNLVHIESRPSKNLEDHYDFFINTDNVSGQLDSAIAELEKVYPKVMVLSSNASNEENTIHWFPKRIRELDRFANQILSYGSELDADHPGFKDEVYKARRKECADIAYNYKHGEPIPRVNYTDEEIKTWGVVFDNLTTLYPTHACKEFNHVFPLLKENCGFRRDNIPQLEDISKFLKDCTGFSVRPVAGLLTSRDFLAGIAHRVFHATQYIRHSSMPLYTPEPDCCHELLGHVPLFADPDFAKFSQEFGLASLGARDEDVKRLATCYWFTVEFGLCREGNDLKAYGAGLLSSFGELKYCLTDKPKKLPFDPAMAGNTEYPITEYQPTYFIADSFVDARKKLSEFAATIDRPFTVQYDPYTQTVIVIDNPLSMSRLVEESMTNMLILQEAIKKSRFEQRAIKMKESAQTQVGQKASM